MPLDSSGSSWVETSWEVRLNIPSGEVFVHLVASFGNVLSVFTPMVIFGGEIDECSGSSSLSARSFFRIFSQSWVLFSALVVASKVYVGFC